MHVLMRCAQLVRARCLTTRNPHARALLAGRASGCLRYELQHGSAASAWPGMLHVHGAQVPVVNGAGPAVT